MYVHVSVLVCVCACVGECGTSHGHSEGGCMQITAKGYICSICLCSNNK